MGYYRYNFLGRFRNGFKGYSPDDFLGYIRSCIGCRCGYRIRKEIYFLVSTGGAAAGSTGTKALRKKIAWVISSYLRLQFSVWGVL